MPSTLASKVEAMESVTALLNGTPLKRSVNSLEAKQPTFEELYTKEVVCILVGPEKKEFRIHKGLLCHESPYFRAALTGGFGEAHEGQVELPEDNTYEFGVFYKWIYTSKIFRDDISSAVKIAKLYIFADKRTIPNLKNLCINTLRDICTSESKNCDPALEFIYENTLPGSALRKFALDSSVWNPDLLHKQLKLYPLWYPREFLLHLAVALIEGSKTRKKEDAPYLKDICQYHDHSAGKDDRTCTK
ncbi:MAG: hypothetical protein M1836_001600 [Candelina mexicana]|nr:MAG: hypothetical protein M1836_001600 [Candelina mexicana]